MGVKVFEMKSRKSKTGFKTVPPNPQNEKGPDLWVQSKNIKKTEKKAEKKKELFIKIKKIIKKVCQNRGVFSPKI